MPIPFRRDLEHALADFVNVRKGLRTGKAFGVPAAFAGRRMFACVIEDGLACRLPDEAVRRELGRGATPFSPSVGPSAKRVRAMSGWVFYRPSRGLFNPQVARALEEGARLAAELSLDATASTARLSSSTLIKRKRKSARKNRQD